MSESQAKYYAEMNADLDEPLGGKDRLVHAWFYLLDGTIEEIYAEAITKGDDFIEVLGGGKIKHYTISALKGYTLNVP